MQHLTSSSLLSLSLHEALSTGLECEWIKARTDLMRQSGFPAYELGEFNFVLKSLVAEAETALRKSNV